ncbi:hypothetical protein LOTGIDRAFT_181794 [Lottia gigantea]|uniref:Glutathione S-transferase omega n=1 Tax=Lottia gigantea TaxID=225164 RepID=V4AKX6_LOTGI|nr:hypothetical protein LOTGIDRAFT_181794 [Lottia gigantea]ESO97797.1 hypothetical protein LOTGIDRAFT_181794 [Lottia gigantea]
MSTKEVKLYSSWFCPFAQRAWIALLEKKVNFQYMEIDPYNKTKEFLSINPRGLVPVIVNNGKCVYESSICIEYVDEAWRNQDTDLMPSDPYERARLRIWSDFISRKIIPAFYQYLMRQSLLNHLETLTSEMSDSGPFFQSSLFGLVDIMLVPFTIRFDMLKHFRGFELPETQIFQRLRRWMEAAHSRETVKATMADGKKLIDKYQRYADDSVKSEVADAIRKGTALP